MPILQGAFDDAKKHYKRHGILGFVPPELRESGRRLLPQAHLASEYSDYGDLVELKEGVQQALNSPLLSWDTLEGTNRALAGGAALLAGPLLSSRLLRDGVDLAASEAGRIARGYVGTPSERGIFAGVNAKTADLDALEKAKGLAADGADARRIWDETGWFKGADDQWRFEIDDSGSRLNDEVYENIKDSGLHEGRYTDTLEHPVAYLGYPELGATKTAVHAKAEPGGSLNHALNLVEAYGPSTSSQRSTLLHEGQHKIQALEGFARGSNYEAAHIEKQMSDLRFKELRESLDGFSDRYDAIARDVLQKADKGDAASAELRRQAELRYERDIGPIDYSGSGPYDLTPEVVVQDYLIQQDPNYRKVVDELNRTLKVRQSATGADVYKAHAGEVEARNVQKRRNMTPDERRAQPPWETEDVPRDQQIVRFGEGRGLLAMAALPGNVGAVDDVVEGVAKRVGDEITHPKFGTGKILSATDKNVKIEFPESGTKTISKSMFEEDLADLVTEEVVNSHSAAEQMVKRLRNAGYKVVGNTGGDLPDNYTGKAGRSSYFNVFTEDGRKLPVRVSDHWSKWDNGLRIDSGADPDEVVDFVSKHFGGTDLPMDTASRMKRAEEMGFGEDLYHGTDAGDFQAFEKGRSGARRNGGAGFWFTDNKNVARKYGERVLETKVRLENPAEVDFGGGSTVYFDGKWRTPDGFAQRLNEVAEDIKNNYSLPEDLEDELRDFGFDPLYGDLDGAVLKNVSDNMSAFDTEIANHTVVFEPEKIRKKSAKFDPTKKDSADLLASIGGVGLLGLGLTQRENANTQ